MWYPLQVNQVKFHEIRTFLYATLIRVIADLFCEILSKYKVRHKYPLRRRLLQDESEDTKEVIRIRKSKKNKQQNDQEKKHKDKQRSTNYTYS